MFNTPPAHAARPSTVHQHRNRSWFTAAALALLTGSLGFSNPSVAGPTIETWQTSSGSRTLFVAAPALPMVDLELVCDAGSARDGDQGGLATLTNGLLFSGAAGLDADQIAAGFDDLGAQTGASVDRDMASVTLRSLSDPAYLTPALKLFSQVIGEPDFPESDFQRERDNLLLALKHEQQQPGAIASRAFYQSMYGTHPYAAMASGTQESVTALTQKQLRRFWNRHYTQSGCLITMVGALTTGQAKEISDQISAALPAGDSTNPPLPIPDFSFSKFTKPADSSKKTDNLVQISHPSQQTHVLIGQPAVSRGDEDFFSLYVGNHVLGGGGLVSRISQVIREDHGLAYSAYSYFAPMRTDGPLVMGLQTRNDQAEQAAQLLRGELDKFLAEGPTEDELTAAKQNLTGGFPLRIAGNGKIIGYLSMIGFYQLPLDYLDSWTEQVEAVTAESIRNAFNKRIDTDKLVEIRVGGE